MEPKKISFGFSKVIKKTNLIAVQRHQELNNKIDLIKCVEGQSIKLLNQENVEKALLVIPMKDNVHTSAALASLKIRREVLQDASNAQENQTDGDKEPSLEIPIEASGDNQETTEQKAVRELLREARGQDSKDELQSNLIVPITAEKLLLDGAIEPTIEDYENIPITQFGLAMLRGMGWKDEDKKKSKSVEDPAVRPKGMGLGADKVLKPKPLIVQPEPNEKLEVKKNACIRILGGKYKDMYGQIEGLDEHAGRVIVKIAAGGKRETFNEFLVQPVSKREFSEYGKVINSTKYEQYKRMENEDKQIIVKQEKDDLTESVEGKNSIKKIKHERQEEEYTSNTHKISRKEYEKRIHGKEEDVKIIKLEQDSSEEERDKNHTSPSRINTDKYLNRSHRKGRKERYSDDSNSDHRHKQKKAYKSKKSKNDKYRYYTSDGDKHHKKKTKKSKRPRSRSREH